MPPMIDKKTEKKKVKTESIKLTKQVSFRLTDADYAAYLEKVEVSGMRPSAFFRQCVLTNKTQVIARANKSSSSEKDKLVFLFNKTSNNMNQLAHRANAERIAGVITESTYTRILEVLEPLAHEMKGIIKNVD